MIQKVYQRRGLLWIVLSVLLFISFYLFSVKVKQERFKSLNFNITSRLQYKIPARFDEFFEDLSFFVSPVPSVFFIGLITIAVAIDVKNKRFRWQAILIPLLFAGLVGVEIFGKDRVESPAPPYFMIKNATTIFPKYHVVDQYSYPSGHAGRSLFISGVICLIFFQNLHIFQQIREKQLITKKTITFIMIVVGLALVTLLISVGKVYLGQHWFSDIMGGWILSGAFLSIFLAFF